MITTVTLNAALDKLYLVEDVVPGTVTRVKEVYNTAGGKGLNVSKVAALAGESVRALGFLGGNTGQYIRTLLRAQNIQDDFTEIDGETRTCINARSLANRTHTEFLEPGVPVKDENLNAFLKKYDRAVLSGDVITLSGSVPPGVPADFYQQLITRAKAAGKPVILDTSGALLCAGVQAKPTLLKPNQDEIAQLFGHEITSREALINAAIDLHHSGISCAAVSLGKEGALLVCAEGVFQGTPPKIKAVNTVGCGDSMVAGFAIGLRRGYAAPEMLRYAVAISAANALTLQTGHFEPADLPRLLEQVHIKKIK